MLDPHVYAVVLAGGSGTRFWPKSRLKSPKQLCSLDGSGVTMISKTLERIDRLIPPERRLIVTHKDQVAKTKEVVADRCQHFLAEPEARNTAAALALASLEVDKLNQSDKPAVLISLHADHVIDDTAAFCSDLQKAVSVAEGGYLSLVGITPRGPETGYGYIERGDALDGQAGFHVASFREKPDLETAKEYLATGRFFWNSGYFIWRTDRFIEELAKYLPNTLRDLQKILPERGTFSDVSSDQLAQTYSQLESIAVDHAILEKSDRVAFVTSNFGWFDIGSWDALDKCFDTDKQGNWLDGDVMLVDTENCTVESDQDFVACIGMRDTVVVQHKGAILVCPKSRAQDVKKIVEALKSQDRKELV